MLKLTIIFDEFDNISTKKARASFADLIKSMSDNNINSTIILVGIADSIESLIERRDYIFKNDFNNEWKKKVTQVLFNFTYFKN